MYRRDVPDMYFPSKGVAHCGFAFRQYIKES
jgi:hypothetical protein